MQEEFKNYLDLILLENKLLEKLNQLGKKKRQYIINQKSAELSSLMQEEIDLVGNIESTEKRRLKLQEIITKNPAAAIDARQMTDYFKRKAPQLEDEFAQAVKSLKNNLTSLQNINRKNQQLLEVSLDYIEDLKSLLGEKVTGTYSEEGTQVNLKNTYKILDKRI